MVTTPLARAGPAPLARAGPLMPNNLASASRRDGTDGLPRPELKLPCPRAGPASNKGLVDHGNAPYILIRGGYKLTSYNP